MSLLLFSSKFSNPLSTAVEKHGDPLTEHGNMFKVSPSIRMYPAYKILYTFGHKQICFKPLSQNNWYNTLINHGLPLMYKSTDAVVDMKKHH